MNRSLSLPACLAAVMLAALTATAQSPPPVFVYLDVDDNPLPFQDDASIVEALQHAPVIHQKLMERGIAGNIKLTLEHKGRIFHAVFRTVDRTVKRDTGSPRIPIEHRDYYIFEVAAYELDRLLGLGRMPPTVLRQIDGRNGSVQIWMEGTTPEDILIAEDRLRPPDLELFRRQKRIMWVFDSLIANADRNQGNILIDGDWNLWFIDHTRAFRETSKLAEAEHITACERRLWDALRSLDEDRLRERLGPYLKSRELAKLERRRKELVRHIEKLIGKNGADAVLFDLAAAPGR